MKRHLSPFQTDFCWFTGKGIMNFFSLPQTLENIKKKQVEKYHKATDGTKEQIECNPYSIFHQALENCKPVVGLASIQKGGKYYQVSKRKK